MEFVELPSESCWSSFYDPTMPGDEFQVMAQIFDVHNFAQDQQMCWPDHDAESYYSLDALSTMFIGSSTPAYESIGGDKIATPYLHAGAYHQLNESLLPSAHANASALQTIKRSLGVGDAEVPIEEEADDNAPTGSVTKKRKIPDALSKKTKKCVSRSNEEESNGGNSNPQSSCCYSSEDDSSSKGSNGKKRASRGSATDPQSLYARKRRERINERLRILQHLVPNGTKVDISTMLEEAVQYVKFLQLQIKLLSSDELWMYAPIAYNGMNLGFDLKTSK